MPYQYVVAVINLILLHKQVESLQLGDPHKYEYNWKAKNTYPKYK